MTKTIDEIIEFLTNNPNSFLIDEVAKKLKIMEVDYELSSIYDETTNIRYNISFEEIVSQTKNLIVKAIRTFKDSE